MPVNPPVAHAGVMIRLLQGAIFSDDTNAWNLLLEHQKPVQDDFARIGLELRLHEPDGFAYLHQPESDDAEHALPRLTRRDRLSYHVTLLCVLLRDSLEQFEASPAESDRLLVSQDELRDLLRPFLPERGDERTLNKKINETVNHVIELGFLKRSSGSSGLLEVRRMIKARFDSQILAEIKGKLEAVHSESVQRDADEDEANADAL
jgi:hypothetical protein